jgi:peptidyl-prolyl cis-trans isomerase C
MRTTLSVLILILLSGGLSAPPALAETQHDPETVLAYEGENILTQKELDGAFHRIPEQHRLAFIRDGENVTRLISSLIVNKTLAAEAYKAGLDQDPLIQERLKLAAEQELASAWREQLTHNVPDADYEAMARERYIANPEGFQTEETRDVSHILISTEDRSEEDAAELANELRKQLESDPGKFDALVSEYSEDPSMDSNLGRFPSVTRGQMVRSFERAAFELQTAGDISKPVKSKFGYHIIRLNGYQEPEPLSFDQAKQGLVEAARKDHLAMYRDNYMTELLKNPIEYPDGALKIMLKRYFGETLERAPDLQGRESHGNE